MPRFVPALLAVALLSACGETARPATVAAVAPPPAPRPLTGGGLDRVIGQRAPALVQLFGKPDLEVHEGKAEKLQFQSPICVLDAYLIPKQPGAEPVVTYVDAREPDGRDIDRASCVAAMTRRR